MPVWARLLLGTAVTLTLAAYAEFVLDIRAPRSNLVSASALAAVVSFPSDQPDKIELAGIYGLFVVTPGSATERTFPFSIVPGNTDLSSYKPTVKNLRDRFESDFPAKLVSLNDANSTIDSCASPLPSEFGFGRYATSLRLRSQTFCVVHWNGTRPGSMLINVTLADADPWMRPFARWICRTMTVAALEKVAMPHREPPTYAACILVDRPDRIEPGNAQDTFKSVVYEVQNRTLARLD